jgi:hypothetical protein
MMDHNIRRDRLQYTHCRRNDLVTDPIAFDNAQVHFCLSSRHPASGWRISKMATLKGLSRK